MVVRRIDKRSGDNAYISVSVSKGSSDLYECLSNMYMILSILALSHVGVVYVNAKCASDLITMGDGMCVAIKEATDRYCKAHETCAALSQTTQQLFILIGLNHKLLDPNKIPTSALFTWTSVSDVLVHRGKAKEGWRDADPRNLLYASQLGDINWDDEQPDGNKPVVGLKQPNLRAHDIQLERIQANVVCELIKEATLETPRINQFKANFPIKLEQEKNDNEISDACYQRLMEPTLLKCSFLCNQNIQCRSVYHNLSQKTCVHILYTDARLPSAFRNIAGEWKRGKAKEGWRDADPRNLLYASQLGDINWDDEQPDGNKPVVGLKQPNLRAHDIQLERIQANVVCELIKEATLETPRINQFKANFPIKLEQEKNDNEISDACYQRLMEPTLLKCSFLCNQNIQCRSVYHNLSQKTCVHILYTDARLPSAFRNIAGEWKRYAKTSITVMKPID
ncbi:hypothetical protein CLF_101572 [Clonorchis sinensis]|uniref:Apple domain-containing protein n=1 Tax=Clonorchis sinensis TaxID=79923 RepID=G7Y623_CLOSI|nr:hypothetical protein CLF_101572 [Clonorchis sinensis]